MCLSYEYYDRTGNRVIVMAKIMNLGAHQPVYVLHGFTEENNGKENS